MTVVQEAQKIIGNWKKLYTPVTKEFIDSINDNNFKNHMMLCDKHKVDLDKVDIQIDYTTVDNIYRLVYLNEYKRIANEYNSKLKDLRVEALNKKEALNKPINDRWNADYKYFEQLKKLHSNFDSYRVLLNLYVKVANMKIKPIEEINLNHVAKKVDDANKILGRFKLINKIINENVLVLNVAVIILLFTIISELCGFIVFLLVSAAAIIAISTGILLKNNEELVSFAVQDIIAPNKDEYKEISFENSPTEFMEFEQKQQLIMDQINSPELKELYAKAQGEGKELYEEEYKSYIDEYREEYNKQIELHEYWKSKIDSFMSDYKNRIVYLGKKWSNSYSMDYNLQLGADEAGEPYVVDIRDKIIVLSDVKEDEKEDLLQLILLSIFSNVRYTNLNVNVYDQAWKLTPYQPINFKMLDGKQMVQVCNLFTDFKTYCETLTNKATEAMSITRKLISVDDYNLKADSKVNANIQYNICISAVSQGDTSAEASDKVFLNMLKYTQPFGFIHIILCNEPKRLALPFETITFE